MIARRGLLGAFLAAPAIIRIPGLLMPVVRPYEMVQRRWAIAIRDYQEGADAYAIAKRAAGFPAWITPDTKMLHMERDFGFLHCFGWEDRVVQRQAVNRAG